MGLQGRDWHIPWHPCISLLFLMLAIAAIPCTEGVCDIEHCWNLFQFAQEHLGIHDEFPLPAHYSNSSPYERDKRCTVRRTFYLCLRNMSRSCLSDLNFRSIYHGLEKQFHNLNCNVSGPVFDTEDIPPTPPPHKPNICTFPDSVMVDTPSSRDKSDTLKTMYDFCALYGDPHLRTFSGEYSTCRLEGVWPLIDNKYFTVQVTNRQHSSGYSHATFVSEATVVIKSHECASDDYLTFIAFGGRLPSTFEDASFEAGPDGAVFIDELVPEEHVEIYLRYIDTTIVIRQISSRMFSLAIKMPQVIVNETVAAANMDPSLFVPVQLCMRGCPLSERIDYREILVESHPVMSSWRSNGGANTEDSDNRAVLQTTLVSRDVAEDICRQSHLLDYYLDSCVYDLMSTGDANFSHAVRLAQSDEFRLVPVLIQQHGNRTSLDKAHIAAFGRARETGAGHSVPSSAAPMQHLHVYLTSFSIYILSHLNYNHRTTFVLMANMSAYFLLFCSAR